MAVEGVSVASGATINDAQWAFLARLRAAVDPSIPLYVTSATRTAMDQARALVPKRDAAEALQAQGKDPGDADLRKLYRRGNGPSIVAALLAVPNDTAAMAAVLQEFMDRGIYLSRHMRGDALDLRTRDWTTAQRGVVVAAAEGLGARALVEYHPPHLHIENIGGGSGASAAVAAAADAARGALQRGGAIAARSVSGGLVAWRRWGRWAVGGAVVVAFFGALFWLWRRRRRGRRP